MPAPPPADAALLALARAVRDTGYLFVTVTPATHARVNARGGNAVARDLAGVFGWSRPFAPGLLPPGLLDLMTAAGVAAAAGEGLLRSRVRLSTLGEDLFLHSAFPTEEAGAVFFGPDTYRFADAIRVALAGRPAPVRRAADIGCGAGPGALVVARAHPGAEVLALDINDEALRLARLNAALADLPGVRALRSDLLSATLGAFDLVVSNPPYLLDPGERTYRHGGGDLGEGLSVAILDAALDRLAPGGTLVLYTGVAVVNGRDPFREVVARRLAERDATWTYREADPDVFGEELLEPAYAGADRIAAVVLTATDRGPKHGRGPQHG